VRRTSLYWVIESGSDVKKRDAYELTMKRKRSRTWAQKGGGWTEQGGLGLMDVGRIP
jgi:hypothetical protein